MSDLFWLSDAQMARLEPYFPKSHGKPRVDDRRVMSRIIFIHRDGLRWRDAPVEYGPHKTLYNFWKRWSDKGIFAQIMAGLAAEHEVHDVIANNRVARAAVVQTAQSAFLRGLIFTETGAAMTPNHTKRKGKRYCYYSARDVIRKRPAAELRGPQRLPGAMVEEAVIGEIRRMLRTPEVAARIARAARDSRDALAAVQRLFNNSQLFARTPAAPTVAIRDDSNFRHEQMLRDMPKPPGSGKGVRSKTGPVH